MKVHSVCLQGYVQVGRKKEGSPNVLGNFNFKKILSTFTLKITCNIYFMTTHLQVFIGQRVNFEPDTPPAPRNRNRGGSRNSVCAGCSLRAADRQVYDEICHCISSFHSQIICAYRQIDVD